MRDSNLTLSWFGMDKNNIFPDHKEQDIIQLILPFQSKINSNQKVISSRSIKLEQQR